MYLSQQQILVEQTTGIFAPVAKYLLVCYNAKQEVILWVCLIYLRRKTLFQKRKEKTIQKSNSNISSNPAVESHRPTKPWVDRYYMSGYDVGEVKGEPFHTLSYADDPLSWNDEKQTRKLYEELFEFYK